MCKNNFLIIGLEVLFCTIHVLLFFFFFDKSVNAILDSAFLISSRFWYLQKHRSDPMQRQNMRWNFLLRQKNQYFQRQNRVSSMLVDPLLPSGSDSSKTKPPPLQGIFDAIKAALPQTSIAAAINNLKAFNKEYAFFSFPFLFLNFTENENFPFRWSFDCFCFELLAFPIFITYFQSPLFAQMLRGHGARIYELCDQGYCLF